MTYYEPIDELKEIHPTHPLRTFNQILAYFSGQWPVAALLGVLVITSSLLNTYPILLIKQVIDIASNQINGELPLLIRLSIIFFIIQFSATITTQALKIVSTWFEGHMGHRIRTQTFNHVQTLSLNFYESRKTGEVLSQLIGDAEVTVQGFIEPVISLARSATVFIFLLYFMISLDWLLTLLCLPAGVIAGGILILFGRVLRQRQKKLREATDQLWSHLIESLQGMRDIQVNNQQESIATQIKKLSESVRSKTMSVNITDTISGGINNLIFMTVIAIILLLGGYQTWSGKMSYGTLTALMMYAHMLVSPISDLASLYRRLQRILVSAERIFKIFEQVPAIIDEPNSMPMETTKGEIEFSHIFFEYEADRDILNDLNLHIYSGQRVALIGPSGGGKTTIVKLLTRFYNPAKGQIKIDNVDIEKIRIESLRSHIGVLFQDIFLFNGTLESNIRFGNPNATASEVENAAYAAGLELLLRQWPKGIHTVVGENGVKLSGGERQRVGLARVLLKSPSIMILDEPASALDTLTAKEIMERLAKERKNCTTLIIAHQISTLIDSDLIVVLSDGHIVEHGTHNQLYASGGLYSLMYEAQFAAPAGHR